MVWLTSDRAWSPRLPARVLFDMVSAWPKLEYLNSPRFLETQIDCLDVIPGIAATCPLLRIFDIGEMQLQLRTGRVETRPPYFIMQNLIILGPLRVSADLDLRSKDEVAPTDESLIRTAFSHLLQSFPRLQRILCETPRPKILWDLLRDEVKMRQVPLLPEERPEGSLCMDVDYLETLLR